MNIRKRQLRNINWILTHLSKHADLSKPEEIDQYISYKKGTNAYKAHLTQVYAKYCDFIKIPYKRPSYDKTNRPFRIPTEEKINMIIANSGKTLATKLTLSKETGLRPVEVHDLKVRDIDLEQLIVYPATAKHGAPRALKISSKLASLIQAHIIRHNLKLNDTIFKGTSEHYGSEYIQVRNRTAQKLNDPTLKTIRLYDLRHYFATMLYHKTKDILLVKQKLGHRRIENTLIYIDLEAILSKRSDEWTCRATDNLDEQKQLIEAGFEYVCTTPQDLMLFRKRK